MAKKKADKSPKAGKRKAAPAAAAEEPVLEAAESTGPGIEEGIAITMFVLLLGAVILVKMLLDERYPTPI